MSEPDANGWMPIETAPIDGTVILVWDGFGVVAAAYDDDPTLEDFIEIADEGEGQAEYEEWLEDDNFGQGWVSHEPVSGDCMILTPLRWQPLPKPPCRPNPPSEGDGQ